jgi:hypothetical protein
MMQPRVLDGPGEVIVELGSDTPAFRVPVENLLV